MTILITGSSGKTAAYLAQMLKADGTSILVASRSPKKGSTKPSVRFDWLDDSTWELPFSHEQSQSSPIKAVYLVAPDVDSARAKVIAFVKYAMQKGVKRFTLLSAWENPEGGPLLGGAHAELKALGQQGIEWAVLRPHFFMGMIEPAKGVSRTRLTIHRELPRRLPSRLYQVGRQDLYCGQRWKKAIHFSPRHCCSRSPDFDRPEAAQCRLYHDRKRVLKLR